MKKKILSCLLAGLTCVLASACQQKTAEPSAKLQETEVRETEPEPEPAAEDPAEEVSEAESEPEPEPEPETEKKKPEIIEVSTGGFTAPDLGYRIESHTAEQKAEEDEDVILYTASWDTVEITKSGYEDLSAALWDWNQKTEEDMLSSEPLTSIEEAYQDMKDYWTPYESVQHARVARFDDAVLSIREENYLFTGGAHGDTAITGKCFDSKTGKELSFSDIAADQGALKSYSLDFLKAYVSRVYDTEEDNQLFEGWENELSSWFNDPQWYLNDYGLEYCIGSYIIGSYAMGQVEVSIPYAELNGKLRGEYMRSEGAFTYQFSYGEEIKVDDSGNRLSASYRVDPDTYNGTVTLQFGEEAITAVENTDWVTNPWVVKEEGGKIYVVLETSVYGEEDMRYWHTVFLLQNGGFSKVDEIEERSVTDAAEVEAIIEGMT